MITVLKYPISEECDHNRSPHKNALFVRIATMITVLTKNALFFIAVFFISTCF